MRSLVDYSGFAALFDLFSKRMGTATASEATRKLRFFEQIVQNISEGVCVTSDRDGLIGYVNPRFEQMFGYAPGEMLGMPITSLIASSEISPQEKYDQIAGVLRRDGSWRGEALSVTKSGRQFWTELSISESHDPVWGKAWLSVCKDITQRKSADALAQTQQAKVVASAKMAALGEMAANIGHEINNPLSIIRATAEDLSDLVRQQQADEATLRRGLDRIELTVERIAKIVRGLRTFAKEEQASPFRETSLREIVSDTVSLCGERLKRHSVGLRVYPIASRIRLECRPIQVSQILLNLLNNAFDAVEPLAEKWVSIEVKEHPYKVEVIVTDSGPGIPPAVRERLMEPFFTTKSGFKGSGLGLSISKGLAESHGGSLEYVESWPNTRFVLTLPKKQPE